MKLGRLILTHRQELILPIKDFYLTGGRTNFLVIAYNRLSVDATKFKEADNFKLMPYFGKELGGSAGGHQYFVWKEVAKSFPHIDAWVIHDYDLQAKPTDREIFSHLNPNEYGCIGMPFPIWQEGMTKSITANIFPFLRHFVSSDLPKNERHKRMEELLVKNFPIMHQGVPTIMTGYADIIAVLREHLLFFDQPSINNFESTGNEQIPATVLNYYKIKPVDLRKSFSCSISLDNTIYIPFNNKFDFSHPVKFWPGINKPSLLLRIKKTIKKLLRKFGPAISYPKFS